MPELPEVEVARRSLSRWIGGAEIREARAADRMVVKAAPAAFARALVGRGVSEVLRRGKWLRVALGDGTALFAHLGMSGKWVRRDPGAPAERWERARIDAERRGRIVSVRYVDPRRLGRIVTSVEDIASWRELGPDPLADGIDTKRLLESFGRTKRTVKETLMDQGVLAGIGNIYATEALFLARIDPRSKAASLRLADVKSLARAITTVLTKTLAQAEEAGEEELTYVSEVRASNPFAVYGRAGKPCPRCKAPLKRVVLAGRGTTFCASCQVRRPK